MESSECSICAGLGVVVCSTTLPNGRSGEGLIFNLSVFHKDSNDDFQALYIAEVRSHKGILVASSPIP